MKLLLPCFLFFTPSSTAFPLLILLFFVYQKILVISWMGQMTGNTAIWSHFLDDLLGLMVQQRRLILSDKTFLTSFMTSLLSSSCKSLLVPQNIGQRYSANALNIMVIIDFIVFSFPTLKNYQAAYIEYYLKIFPWYFFCDLSIEKIIFKWCLLCHFE